MKEDKIVVTDHTANLESRFKNVPKEFRVSIFFDIDGAKEREEIADFVAECKRAGVGRIIPRFSRDYKFVAQNTDMLSQLSFIVEEAEKNGLRIGLDETCFLNTGHNEDFEVDKAMRCCLLETREYACTELERLELMIHPGKLMSIVAVDEEWDEIIDLRPHLSHNILHWQVPRGNWTVIQYICRRDYVSPHVNYLSYRTSYDYIESVYRPVIERFQNKMGRVIDCLFYHDVQYVTPNRRMWDEDFNRVFEAEFGYDPAPYYPALFRQIGADTSHYKALFFHCRAKLLQNGFLKAIADFCKTHSLWCVGTQSGAKFPACSFLHGDGMMASRYADAPCAQMSGAYLYGQNSLKIAEGAAAGVGGETVAAEMFDGYEESTPPLLYREMILSYSKRINHIFAHLPPTKGVTTLSERLRQAFFDGDGSHLWPAARTQALLSEGRQICDIALLYPIYSLHEEAYLYEDNHTHGYEFASIPENADYMNVINAITEYVGLDLTVLHPEIIKEGCRTEGGRLILETVAGTAEYRVVVLPAGCLIGIDTLRLLKRFYDEGGKIVATGELPAAAFEFDGEYGSDEEVVRTILHIFGTECFNLGSIRKYCENQNDRGGQAYFFYSTMSALDGTYTVSGNLLEEVFKSFRLPYDVVLADPPHRETGGLLNIPLHEYLAMDKYYHINKTGTVSYIHKEAEGADIYYFANSRSEEEYLDRVLLRGRKELELWNPRTGEIESCPCEHTVENGQPYTKILLRLPPASGIFVVAKV